MSAAHRLASNWLGKHLPEDLLPRAGHAFPSITGWHTRHPVLDYGLASGIDRRVAGARCAAPSHVPEIKKYETQD
jgi:hypothetical protein